MTARRSERAIARDTTKEFTRANWAARLAWVFAEATARGDFDLADALLDDLLALGDPQEPDATEEP